MTTDFSDGVKDYIDRSLKHLWIHTVQQDELEQDDALLVIRSGEGIYLTDSKARKYIDLMSGLWVVAVGHGREQLADIAGEQMSRMSFANPFSYATEPAIDLATRLAEISPPGLERAFFVNSGSEAVETAIRMAKQWQYNRGDQRKFKVISRVGSYHGTTYGALSINHSSYMNKTPFEPMMPGAVKAPGELNADLIEQVVLQEKPETVAAIIAEPISTANGSHVPAPEYWKKLRALCDEHDIVLIADEVINGFGRTGKWFAMEHFGVTPDLITVAKQLSSGYAPIAAVLASEKISDGFRGDTSKALIGGSTWGAHPVSCAVALGNLDIIANERLVENSEKTGAYIAEQLLELQNRHSGIVADTRGIGLMQVIDLKRNVEADESFREEDEIGKIVGQAMRDNGLLSRGGATIQIAPPLVINREEADEIVDSLDQVLDTVESTYGLK